MSGLIHLVLECPSEDVGSRTVPESLKTTLRWDPGIKADAERYAKARGISPAEFIRQAITHYCAWCEAHPVAVETPDESLEQPQDVGQG